MGNKNKRLMVLRILIPTLIVVAIVGVWVIKNYPDLTTKGSASTPTSSVEMLEGENTIPTETQNVKDFQLEATTVNLDQLLEHDLPIVIDFGADSCEPCKRMAPVLISMNEEMQGKAIIKFIDVWKYPEAASDFPLQLIPTQFFISADGSPYVPSEDVGVALEMYHYNDTGEHAFTAHQGGLTEDELRAILDDMGVES